MKKSTKLLSVILAVVMIFSNYVRNGVCRKDEVSDL